MTTHSPAQNPAGLLTGDVTLYPYGLAVAVLTGKTKHSLRNTKIRYPDEIHANVPVPEGHQ